MKSFLSVLKKSPMDMMKNILKKKYPNLANVDFELQQRIGECPGCGQAGIPEYWIKREQDQDFIKVPIESGVCIRCEDKKLANEAIRDHLVKRIQRETEQFFIVPPELESESLATYKPADENQLKALQAAVEFVKDFSNGTTYNLLFRGSYGGGKSHLLKGIAEKIKGMTKKVEYNGREYEVPYSVGFLTAEKLLEMIKGTFGRREGQTEHEIMKTIIDLDFLVIDDLGTESGEWTGKKIFEIVNSRQGKVTAYSTNFMDDNELAARFDTNGGKIVSRLYANTKIIELITKDMRKEKQI